MFREARSEPAHLSPGGTRYCPLLIFINSYNVYLHDTSAPELFAQQERLFSHGCIRVSSPDRLAAFLLDGAEGRYREPMVRYLQAVYTRRDNDQTLAEATGSSYSELDAAYRRFMESLP